MFSATQQAACTAPVALPEIYAQSVATVLVKVLGTCIGADVRMSLGNRQIALQNVEIVRNRPSSRTTFCFSQKFS